MNPPSQPQQPPSPAPAPDDNDLIRALAGRGVSISAGGGFLNPLDPGPLPPSRPTSPAGFTRAGCARLPLRRAAVGAAFCAVTVLSGTAQAHPDGGEHAGRPTATASVTASATPWTIALPPDPSATARPTPDATPSTWTGPSPSSTGTTGEPSASSGATGEPTPSTSSSAWSSSGQPGDAEGPVLHVAPDGQGDGSSWEDAAGLEDLPELVEELDGGGQVWLRGDAGAYEVEESIALTAGGTDGEPVVIRGVDEDGDPDPAEIESDRTDPYEQDGERGSDVFKLRDGADFLTFRDLAFANVGAAFTVAGPVEDLAIEEVTADNVRYFLTNLNGENRSGGDATISGLTIRRIDVIGFSKSALMLRYDSHDVLVEDVVRDSEGQDGDDFTMGVSLKGRVRDVVLRRVRMDNSVSTRGTYWNGDGFATERGVDDVLLEDTSASGSTDAGYDLKSSNTRLVDAKASGNKRNFRFWSAVFECLRCLGQDPQKRGGSGGAAQVWLSKGAEARFQDSELLDSGDLVIEAENDAQLELTGGRITRDDDGELARTDDGADVDLSDVDDVDVAGPVDRDQ